MNLEQKTNAWVDKCIPPAHEPDDIFSVEGAYDGNYILQKQADRAVANAFFVKIAKLRADFRAWVSGEYNFCDVFCVIGDLKKKVKIYERSNELLPNS